MRGKRNWERVRSPHARFLEGLQAAVASHPSASARVGAITDERSHSGKARLTIVGSTGDNVIPLPTDRSRERRRLGSTGRPDPGGSPAA
jgi:hypothetical protein